MTDDDRTLFKADLEGFARRAANAIQQAAEIKHKAAVYTSELYRDAIIEEVWALLRTVVMHERVQAGRALATCWIERGMASMATTTDMTAQEFINMLARFYKDAPGDKVISIGHWIGDDPYKTMSAQVFIHVDDLRRWQTNPQ